jgi:hypothetical protein
VAWVEVFAVLIVSHLVGDFVFQTEWQATHKHGGLGADSTKRRALTAHLTTYTLAFAPAFVWLAITQGVVTVAVAAVVVIPHLVQDDGRLVALWLTRVKRTPSTDNELVFLAVDQSFHATVLLGAALLAMA